MKLTKKELLIIISSGILALTILITIALVSIYNKVELGKTRLKLKENNNNISYYAQKDEYSNINLIVRNNTNKTISRLSVTITFYDSNNSLLATNTDYIDNILIPDETTIMQCNDYTTEEYDHYNIAFSYTEVNEAEKVNYSGLKYRKGVIKEDSPDYLSISFKANKKEQNFNTVVICTVFYKDKKIIGFSSNNVYSVENGSLYEIKPRLPEDSSGNKLDYDYYELFVVN